MRHVLLIAAATIALAACNRAEAPAADVNATLADANASGAEAANAVLAQADTPLEREAALAVMKERHEGYERIGKAMRAAKQALDRGDAAAVKAPADEIATLAPKAVGWFPLGTGPDVGKTEAKAEIWQQKSEFDKGMTAFNEAARSFQTAAASGDLAAIKAAHGNLGKTCGSCHDRFRLEDK